MATPNSPAWKLERQFWYTISGLGNRFDVPKTPGVLAILIRASVANPKKIPETMPVALHEAFDPALVDRLPGIFNHPSPDYRAIFEGHIEKWGRLEAYAKFECTESKISNANIFKIVHNGEIVSSPAEPMEEEPQRFELKEKPLSPETIPTPAVALRSWAERLTGGIDARSAELDSVIDASRLELAKVLQPIINGRIAVSIREGLSYRAKAALAISINEEVRNNGLTIQCVVDNPKSPDHGKSFHGYLVANPSRKVDGRFAVEYQDESGTKGRVPISSPDECVHLVPLASNLSNLKPLEVASNFVDKISGESISRYSGH